MKTNPQEGQAEPGQDEETEKQKKRLKNTGDPTNKRNKLTV